jgi:two-component sensor histidine kinase
VIKTIRKTRKKKRKFQEEYRLKRKNGSYIYVNVAGTYLPDEEGHPNRIVGVIKDITERKEAEKALEKIEEVRKKEIHHRIKNNLQVICSLLDLQAEKFSCRAAVPTQEILEAFRESQNRVISMALIHEELYKADGTDTLDFSAYLKKLTENLFRTYSLSSKSICLYMDLEKNAFFNIDAAVPLGIIVNELVSNSLKHAFQGRDKGEIRIKLHREEKGESIKKGEFVISRGQSKSEAFKSTVFILTVSDDGIGIPESLDLESLDSLGFQLVTSLVDQLDGELELERKNGTEFTMRFMVTELNKQVEPNR